MPRRAATAMEIDDNEIEVHAFRQGRAREEFPGSRMRSMTEGRTRRRGEQSSSAEECARARPRTSADLGRFA